MPDNTYKNVIKAAIDGFNSIQTALTNFNASSSSATTGLKTGTDAVSTLTTTGTTVSGNITPAAMVTAIQKLAVIRKSDNSYATGKISLYDFGFTGTGTTSGTTVTIGSVSGIVLSTAGKYNEDDITVNLLGASNITAANIKHNVSFLGVTGTFTSDADAIAANILYGKTAYVKGSKVTGSIPTVSMTAGNGFVDLERVDTGSTATKVNSTLLYPTSNSNYGSILTSSTSLVDNDIYYLELKGTGRGTVSVGTTGYIIAASQNSNNKVTTYYVPVKAGSVSHVGGKITASDGSVAISPVANKFPSGILSLTPFNGTEGQDYYTIQGTGSGKVSMSALSYKTTAGYIPANTGENANGVGVVSSENNASVNLSEAAEYTSNTATVPYYIRRGTGQIALEALAGNVSATNAELETTNNSGIRVEGSGRVKGAFTVDDAGIFPKSYSATTEDNGLSSNTSVQFLKSITVGSSSGDVRTLNAVTVAATGRITTMNVNAGGIVTGLTLNGTITTLNTPAGSAIGTLSGSTSVGTLSGTLTIGTNTNGVISLFGGENAEHGIKISNGIVYADYIQTITNGETTYTPTQVTEMVSNKPSLIRANIVAGSWTATASNISGQPDLVKSAGQVGNSSGNYYSFKVGGSGNSAVNKAGWIDLDSSTMNNLPGGSGENTYYILKGTGASVTSLGSTDTRDVKDVVSGTEIQPNGYAQIAAGYYPNPFYVFARRADQAHESIDASGFSLDVTSISPATATITIGSSPISGDTGYYPVTANLSIGAKLSASSAGWFSTGTATDSSTTGSVGKVKVGVETNNTTLASGKTSSGTINEGNYIKISSGYYHNDLYYKAWETSGTYTATGPVRISADKGIDGDTQTR